MDSVLGRVGIYACVYVWIIPCAVRHCVYGRLFQPYHDEAQLRSHRVQEAVAAEEGNEKGDPPEAWRHLALLALGMVMVFSTWFSVTAAIPQLQVKWHLSSGEESLLTIGA